MDREAFAKQQRRLKTAERSLQAALLIGALAVGAWHAKVYAEQEPRVILTLEKIQPTKLAGGN